MFLNETPTNHDKKPCHDFFLTWSPFGCFCTIVYIYGIDLYHTFQFFFKLQIVFYRFLFFRE